MTMTSARLRPGLWALVLTLTVLAACEKEVILPGERFGTRDPLDASIPTEEVPVPVAPEAPGNVSAPISLPGATANANWPTRGGSVTHDGPHGALSAVPVLAFAVDIGQGNSRQNRVAAAPVVADGRVFAMDARVTLSAVSTAGALLWQADLTPPFDHNSALSGGGLAVDGGTVFATTGYGELIALDAATGSIRWRQRFEAVVSGAPLATGGAVYVSARDGTIWSVDQSDGKVNWTETGVPGDQAMIGSAAPALSGDIVVFPFSSGTLGAISTDGEGRWLSSATGERAGRAYAGIADVTGDPVVVGGVIYLGTAAGRTQAISAENGQVIWSTGEGALEPPLVVGGSVFTVNDQAELVRMDAGSGEVIWRAPMPYFDKDEPKRRKAITAHYGPVLAGGRLAVVSGDGWLRLFNATDGSLAGAVELPGGAASAPALAAGGLYVVSAAGQLLAFR